MLESLGRPSPGSPARAHRLPHPRPAELLHGRPQGVRAWTIRPGSPPRRPPASSTPTSSAASSGPRSSRFDDLVRPGRWPPPSPPARSASRARTTSCRDGDVVEFRFNVWNTAITARSRPATSWCGARCGASGPARSRPLVGLRSADPASVPVRRTAPGRRCRCPNRSATAITDSPCAAGPTRSGVAGRGIGRGWSPAAAAATRRSVCRSSRAGIAHRTGREQFRPRHVRTPRGAPTTLAAAWRRGTVLVERGSSARYGPSARVPAATRCARPAHEVDILHTQTGRLADPSPDPAGRSDHARFRRGIASPRPLPPDGQSDHSLPMRRRNESTHTIRRHPRSNAARGVAERSRPRGCATSLVPRLCTIERPMPAPPTSHRCSRRTPSWSQRSGSRSCSRRVARSFGLWIRPPAQRRAYSRTVVVSKGSTYWPRIRSRLELRDETLCVDLAAEGSLALSSSVVTPSGEPLTVPPRSRLSMLAMSGRRVLDPSPHPVGVEPNVLSPTLYRPAALHRGHATGREFRLARSGTRRRPEGSTDGRRWVVAKRSPDPRVMIFVLALLTPFMRRFWRSAARSWAYSRARAAAATARAVSPSLAHPVPA